MSQSEAPSLRGQAQAEYEVFDRIEEKLKELRPQDTEDLLSILASTDYSRMAMDAVHGNPKNVTPRTVEEITKNIETSLEKTVAKKFERRFERMAKIHAAKDQESTLKNINLAQTNEDAVAIITDLHDVAAREALVAFDRAKRSLKQIQTLQNILAVVIAAIVFLAA